MLCFAKVRIFSVATKKESAFVSQSRMKAGFYPENAQCKRVKLMIEVENFCFGCSPALRWLPGSRADHLVSEETASIPFALAVHFLPFISEPPLGEAGV